MRTVLGNSPFGLGMTEPQKVDAEVSVLMPCKPGCCVRIASYRACRRGEPAPFWSGGPCRLYLGIYPEAKF